MPCDHAGGPELIEMAETHLRGAAVPERDWNGLRFRWAENLAGSMWASVIVEVERRGEQWVVVRLDRNREPLDENALGFRRVCDAGAKLETPSASAADGDPAHPPSSGS